MSSIDFAHLTSERPDLADAWSKLLLWMTRHPDVPLFDPRRIARELASDPEGLYRIGKALDLLAEEGLVSYGFTVEEPGGGLHDTIFESPDAIPDMLLDRFDHPFSAEHHPIVPVYRREFPTSSLR